MSLTDRFSQRYESLKPSEDDINDRFSKRNKFLSESDLTDEPKQDSESDYLQSAASFTSHGLGIIPAFPGNVRDLVHATGEEAKNLRKSFFENLGMSWAEESLQKYDQETQESESPYLAPFKFLTDKLPNTQDVNKFIDEYDEGYLAPKSDRQKLANDTAQDIVNSFLNRGPKGIFRNFIIPGVSNVVKKGMELFGADPKTSELGKWFTWIGLDLAGASNTRGMLSSRMQQNRRQIPRNDTVPMTPRDIRHLDNLEDRLRSGGTAPSKTAALTKIEEIRNSIVNGRIPATELHDFYRTSNEIKSAYGAFNVDGSNKPAHVFNLNRVQRLVRNKLDNYGRNQNPEYLRNFRENNSAWAAMEQSDAVASYVKKNYNKPFVSESAKVLFSKPYGLPTAVGLTALERTQAFIQRLSNPTLRRYYGDIISNSIRDNRAGMISSMQKFDKLLEKEEEND